MVEHVGDNSGEEVTVKEEACSCLTDETESKEDTDEGELEVRGDAVMHGGDAVERCL